jgi:hypothetical protein
MQRLILAFALLLSSGLEPAPGKPFEAQGKQDLVGTWRLVHFTRTFADTGQTVESFGKAPSGFIQFGGDGRIMLLIVKEERPIAADPEKMTDQQRAELFRTMIGYGGSYIFDGKTLTCHLEVSWNQAWTGTDIQRQVMLEGRRLTLVTEPHKSYVDDKVVTGELTFERVP